MSIPDPFGEDTTAWLSTTASQIFFMQLGFLCYEVGFVKPIWTQSIILKNIQDTFVGILTFLALGFTLSESPQSFYGIISVPINPFLIGVDAHMHSHILISAFFASTSATIISGCVLERMKNKAYLLWCFLVVLLNYSVIAHWVWHKDGWLQSLGFVDGAGAVVVHTTAGMASLVAVWRLGPRKESLEKDGVTLKPIPPASRPIVNVTGAFFLWYGWFAFNVSSPIAFSKGIGHAIGTTALVTVVSPVCAVCSGFALMYFKLVNLSFEHLLSCLLCGLVAITGACHTCHVWAAAVIGFLSSIVYFMGAYIVRAKLHIDDPMQVIAIHLFGGIFSCLCEGIVANDVYGSPGLIYGQWKHFGVQMLGITVVCAFDFVLCIFLYDIIFKRLIFRDRNIRVSVLDVFLGTQIFQTDHTAALAEVLKCETNIAKRMLWQFHKYLSARFAAEQLDFLISVNVLEHYLSTHTHNMDSEKMKDKARSKIAKHTIQIIDTYVEEHTDKTINVSGATRGALLKIKNQISVELQSTAVSVQDLASTDLAISETQKREIDPNRSASLIYYRPGFYSSGLDIIKEHIFKTCFSDVWRIVLPHFTQFLRHELNSAERHKKFAVKIPFTLKRDWTVEWDVIIQKQNENMGLADTIPRLHESVSLLNKNDPMQIELEHVTANNTGYDALFKTNTISSIHSPSDNTE